MSLNFSHQAEIYPLFLAEAQSLLMQVEEMFKHADTIEATARTVEHLGQAIGRIKSGGAYLALPTIEIFCHRFEGILQRITMANAESKPEVLDLLRQTLAGLHRLVSTQQQTRDDADVLIQIQPIFTQLEEQLNDAFVGTDVAQQLSFFLEDASDWLETIETALLDLQAGDRSLNNIHRLMRTTHTLKGAASGAGLEVIQRMAHALETIFQALYKPSVRIDPDLTELLFQAYGCLRLPISARMTQTPMNESDIAQQFDTIAEQLQASLEEALAHPAQMPTSRELGVDVVDPIFRTEVAQRLQNLSVLIQSDAEDRATCFRSQIEVLRDIAESFNLQGFSDIARTTLLALEYHPAQLQSIAQIALQDFQNGFVLILDGDRTNGGAVSDELRQMAQPLMPQFDLQPQNGERQEGLFPLSEDAMESPSALSQPLRSPASAPVKTIRVDISRLEHLNRLTGELLNSQRQQGSTNEQLQDTLQNLGSRFQQHQQSLRQIYALAAHFLTPPDSATSAMEGFSSESIRLKNLKIEQDDRLNVLLRSALEESLQLADMAGKATRFHRQSSQTLKQQQQLLVDVRNDLTGARIVPLGNMFRRLQRVFRQLMATHNKSAVLKLSGTQISIDKAIAEQLYDPLLHLLSNALDHSVEPETVRRQLGKPERVQIYIHADNQNDWIAIEVGDDGAGLDYEKIREQAIEFGILSSDQAQHVAEQTLAELLFHPGFTTASRASALSGRGVGLDVVLSHIRALGGSVTIQSQPQRGTVVKLLAPRALTIEKVGIADSTPASALTDLEIRAEYPQPQAAVLSSEAAFPADSTDLPSLDDLFGNLDLAVRTPTQEPTLPDPLPSPMSSRQRATPFIPYGEIARSRPSVSLPPPISSPTNDTKRPSGNFAHSEAATERVLDLSLLFAWRFGTVVFTLPFDRIEEHIAPQDRQVVYDPQQRFLQWNGNRISLYSLSDLLEPKDILSGLTANATEGQTSLTLAVRIGQRIIAIESTIHQLITMRKLTIQSLSADIRPPSYIYGSALADNFSVMLVDVAALLDRTFGNAGSALIEGRQFIRSVPSSPMTPPIKVPSRTILIVDDSKMIREVLKDTLTSANYRVLEAVDGQDALDKVRHRHLEIGLVICDVAMPKMNGFDFLRGFRQLSVSTNVPVVMLSTCGSEVHRQLASRLGASAYWTKPYDEQQLLAAIKHLLLQSSMLS
jgi:chemotaxis protein histidine kinase CheA/ActR/RegA family two-component response regulator